VHCTSYLILTPDDLELSLFKVIKITSNISKTVTETMMESMEVE